MNFAFDIIYDIHGKNQIYIQLQLIHLLHRKHKNIKHVVTWYTGKHVTFKNWPQTYAISRLRNYEMEFIKRHIIT